MAAGDLTRSQGISSHGIDLVILEYASLDEDIKIWTQSPLNVILVYVNIGAE